ncbi:hypothetical protein JCM19046_2385 [Bacillus sp. JCM 19046]|uniref:DUF4282 domain-containing protein n=1 Tax=Shouchella xiaoxiensis TaxID=766895 RepID=A0ABS2SRP4_9BACI|nr:hypothetical protein [Shouchella xiaoxiensis]MBM7838189.1 hypothetical protein [Shouchella xiaoxiensis]GAF12063.1 hypothetical protein JCM19045_1219 [Bacillus sp. JCM 19045]GAF17854.1 hypothetical protein JCM19046_2385 [Bacillus sp. JCM 19046]
MIHFFRLERMFTPAILHWLYWLAIGLCIVASIYLFSFGTVIPVLTGLLILIVGPILFRVFSELILAVFYMLESLNDRQ